jgi:hypothetical protein
MRSWSSWAVLAAVACPSFFGGCTDSGRHSSLRFEIAPACGGAATVQIGCVEVEVCESDDPDRCVAVAPVGGPYPLAEEDGVTSVLVPVVGGSLRFDVRANPGTLYDVDVVAFGESSGGRSAPVAAGHATRVSLEGGSSTVRLYPTDAWTCPEEDDALTLRRAFHQSVPLSNGRRAHRGRGHVRANDDGARARRGDPDRGGSCPAPSPSSCTTRATSASTP